MIEFELNQLYKNNQLTYSYRVTLDKQEYLTYNLTLDLNPLFELLESF